MTDRAAKRVYEEELLVGEAMENIVALLRSLGISQRQLATRLGVTEGRVSQIVSGAENLTLHSLAAIGWALGVRFELHPNALTGAEREGTPSQDDPTPPAWLRSLLPTFHGDGPRPGVDTNRSADLLDVMEDPSELREAYVREAQE